MLAPAHENSIQAMAIDFSGRFLATASEKGTLIRIFLTEDASLLQELRRGSDKATIFSISFNMSANLLACSSSDKSTIHIFSVVHPEGTEAASVPEEEAKNGEANKKNKKKFGFFKKIGGNYFDSEFSFATLKVADTRAAAVGFAGEHNLIVVTREGVFYSAEIPDQGGKCVIREQVNI